MERALTSGQMRAVEDAAVAHGVATLGGLMERAGAALAAEVERRAPGGRVVVVAGPGNNGGDGWVAARVLVEGGRDVRVLTLRTPEELAGDAGHAAERAVAAGVPWTVPDAMAEELEGASAVIDAIFGFGFRGTPEEPYAAAIAAIDACDAPVIAADVPSGVDADTGAVVGAVVRADATVTFSAYKPGLLLYPGAACAGEITVVDIGIPAEMTAVAGSMEVPMVADLAPLLPWPKPEDHKGTRGRVAIVAGSAAFSGAALLAVSGALRMGAGYVYAVVPEPMAGAVRVALPGAIVRALAAARDGSFAAAADVLAAVADADAVVAGPGITTSAGAAGAVRALVERIPVPLVLDADGLNAFAGEAERLFARMSPLVITPHPGEAARLLGCTAADIGADRPAAAMRLANEARVCLLKGPRTLVAGGGRMSVVRAGNAGLAHAGSGDVLAGMLGTLLAQGVPPFDGAVLAAHLHGRAADFGTAVLTETCFGAADITAFLPEAVRELAGG
jgi:NAD(P)H-hydrate epimerase